MTKEIEISQRCEMNDCKSMVSDQRQQIEYQGMVTEKKRSIGHYLNELYCLSIALDYDLISNL